MPPAFGEYLRDQREQLRLTRQRVADESGLSYAYLAQLESGKKSSPSPTVLGQLAHALGVPLEELGQHAGVDLEPSVAASRSSGPTPRTTVEWLDNPLRAAPVAEMADVALPNVGVGARSPRSPRTRRRSSPPELQTARAEVLPALERLLDGWSPVTRIALLNELQAAALRDLGV